MGNLCVGTDGMPSHGLMVIFCNRRSGLYVITHAEFTILLPLCHHFSVAVCMLSACTKMEFAQALRHLKGKDLLDALWSLWTMAGREPPGTCLNWCEMSVMLILSKGLWGSNTTFISKEMFHFKRCLKSITWKWLQFYKKTPEGWICWTAVYLAFQYCFKTSS